MGDWPAGWEEVDAAGPNEFERVCINRWADVRNALEPRELEDAFDQCEEADEALVERAVDGEVCDTLRVLYVD